MHIHLTSYGQGKALVLFHGWGFDSSVWLPLVENLQTTCQVILVDLPGFGRTPLQSWDTFKSGLLARLPPQFFLLGWSLGGLFASRLAIDASEKVQGLINVTSSPRFIAEGAWPGVDRAVFTHFYANLAGDFKQTLRDFVQLQAKNSTFNYETLITPSAEGLQSGLQILADWDLRSGLNQLEIPVCFMFGRLDPITPIKTLHALQAQHPHFHYVTFNKAAHMPFLSHSELFLHELNEFIV